MKDIDLFKKDYNLFLKQQMMISGVNLKELAEKIEYSYEGVRQILKGRGSYWGVYRVCKVLRINMKRLLNDKIFKDN